MQYHDIDAAESREIELISRISEDLPSILEGLNQLEVSRSGLKDRLMVLGRSLQNQSVQSPVYTRFRTENACTILPVFAIQVSAEVAEVVHTEGQMTIDIKYLTELTAFCDANRKPVFLNEEFALEELNSQSERTATLEREFHQWEESLQKWLRRVEDEGNSRLGLHTKMVA